MTAPLFPKPAATLPGEADILARVLADQSDDAAKLVYADWLQDRDDPRGPFLRDCVTAFRAGKALPSAKTVPRPWCDLVGVTLMRNVLTSGLTAHADKFLRLARPALDYKAARAADKKIPVGVSKLGGLPDLPSGVPWPTHDENPLSFLGQFNFAELSQSVVCRELPKAGWLSVFCRYDEGDGNDDFPTGTWRMLHFPVGANLARAESGPEITFRSGRVAFSETLTLPEAGSPWDEDLGLGKDRDTGWAYQEKVAGFRGGHQILGYPGSIQSSVLDEKTERHLLTIGPDPVTGWEWGDGGSLYFILSEANLLAGRFDRVRMEMQCG
jgi:uncharacterized protein (TIGR02996 family)